jgi:hypothetical protein
MTKINYKIVPRRLLVMLRFLNSFTSVFKSVSENFNLVLKVLNQRILGILLDVDHRSESESKSHHFASELFLAPITPGKDDISR